jgi:Zn-dependent peptidase ImmA (M78 family)/DNA-binding XRE family transcriptional regulator
MPSHVLDTIDPTTLGEQLTDARKARGLTQQAAAEALGVARTTIVAMEKGERRPRPGELVRLAALYGRPVGDLMRAIAEPPRESFVVQFRAARSRSDLNRDEKREADIREFEALCRDYTELERITNSPLSRRYPDEYDVSQSDPERAAEEVAVSERNRLALGDGPIGDLWGILEADVGLRIFAQSFSDTHLAGLFVFTEEYGGCISVNLHHPESRQRWTAAHEYGHFLTNRYRPEITTLQTYKRVPESERFADAFARHFLMPSSGLTRRFQAMKRSKEGPVTPADVLALAHLYQVSFTALMLRLEELRLIALGSWDRLRDAGFKPNDARRLLDLDPVAQKRPPLPYRYEALAVRAYVMGKLSQERLAKILRLDPVDARERVEELAHGQFFEDGELYQMSLDLDAELTSSGR